MKTQYAAHFNMIEACISTAEANTDAWKGFGAFNNAYQHIRKELIPQLFESLGSASQHTAPATIEKAAKREELERLTRKMALAIRGFSSQAGNDKLLADASVTATALQRASDLELVGMATKLLHLAQAMPDKELELWNVSEDELKSFANSIAVYLEDAGHPRGRRSQIREASDASSNLIRRICRIFREQLDGAVIIMKESQPAFFSQWFTARRILHLNGRTRALELGVTAGGKALANATITISNGKSRRSSVNGKARVQHLQPGAYTVTVSAEGYSDKTVSFEVKSGETSTVSVEMEV